MLSKYSHIFRQSCPQRFISGNAFLFNRVLVRMKSKHMPKKKKPSQQMVSTSTNVVVNPLNQILCLS